MFVCGLRLLFLSCIELSVQLSSGMQNKKMESMQSMGAPGAGLNTDLCPDLDTKWSLEHEPFVCVTQ